MIIREWKCRTTRERAHEYPQHFRDHVANQLRVTSGFLGGDLVRRDHASGVEYTVLTRWVSVQAISEFAGLDIDRAVVEEGAVAALTDFDEFVVHHEVVTHIQIVDARTTPPSPHLDD